MGLREPIADHNTNETYVPLSGDYVIVISLNKHHGAHRTYTALISVEHPRALRTHTMIV